MYVTKYLKCSKPAYFEHAVPYQKHFLKIKNFQNYVWANKLKCMLPVKWTSSVDKLKSVTGLLCKGFCLL